MSKGLEAIKRIKWELDITLEERINLCEYIEKELKALEIIKEKRVDIGWLIRSENCSKYNLGVGSSQALKKQEYDLLKEVLLWFVN